MKDYHTDVSRDRETALNDAYECCEYLREAVKEVYKDLKTIVNYLDQAEELIEQAQNDDR